MLGLSQWPSRLAITLIRLYQRRISFLLGPRCRFYPTCSSYAACAFDRYGFFKGIVLSFIRIVKCNPWHPGGIDFVDNCSDNVDNHEG